MRIISIDGDNYGLTIPSSDDCFGLMEACLDFADSFCVVKREKEAAYVCDFFSAQVIKGNIYYTMTYCIQRAHQRVVDFSEFQKDPPQYLVNFRPCLVPLNREGKQDMDFAKANPNGTLLTGGHPYFNGKPYLEQFQSSAHYTETFHMKMGPEKGELKIDCLPYQNQMPREWDPDEEITIGNSIGGPENNLKWLVWDGRLVCLYPLLRLRPGELPNIVDIFDPSMPIDRRTRR